MPRTYHHKENEVDLAKHGRQGFHGKRTSPLSFIGGAWAPPSFSLGISLTGPFFLFFLGFSKADMNHRLYYGPVRLTL